MQEYYLYFLGLLFVAVFFVSQAFLLPTAGKKIKNKVLARRLKDSQSGLDSESRTLLNEHYMKSLSPFDRKLVRMNFFSNMKKKFRTSRITMVIESSCYCHFHFAGMYNIYSAHNKSPCIFSVTHIIFLVVGYVVLYGKKNCNSS